MRQKLLTLLLWSLASALLVKEVGYLVLESVTCVLLRAESSDVVKYPAKLPLKTGRSARGLESSSCVERRPKLKSVGREVDRNRCAQWARSSGSHHFGEPGNLVFWPGILESKVFQAN